VCEICSTFSPRDFFKASGDGLAKTLDGVGRTLQCVGSNLAEDGFEFGECLLDRVEIRAVRGKLDKYCTAPLDGFAHESRLL